MCFALRVWHNGYGVRARGGGGSVVKPKPDVSVSYIGRAVDGGGRRSGMPGARSTRARAPLTSATARRRAALVTTVAGQLLFYTHERKRRETKGDDGGGERAERARRRSDARRHLAGHATTTRAYSFRVCGRSKCNGTAAMPEPHWRQKHCHCTVLTHGASVWPCSVGVLRVASGAWSGSYRRQSVAACGGGGR